MSKKLTSSVLCFMMLLSVLTFSGFNVGAKSTSLTVSNGNAETLQSYLDKADSVGTKANPLVINITKNIVSDIQICVHSNTKLVVKKGVKITRNIGRSSNSQLVRFGAKGSYSDGYAYKNITIVGGTWDGNGKKGDTAFCVFKLAHAENIVLKNCSFKNTVENHLVEIDAVRNLTIENCDFDNVIPNYTSTVEHQEALQLDVNHPDTSMMDNYDTKQNSNITVRNCSFKNAGRGIGTHSDIEGLYFYNMVIENNTFSNIKSLAIRTVNYRNSKICNNTIKNCGGGIFFSNGPFDRDTKTSFVVPEWKLKLNTKTDNSVISGNKITTSKNSKDYKPIVVYGHNYKNAVSGKVLKGDHYVRGITVSNNTVNVPDNAGIFLQGAKKCKVINNTVNFTDKKLKRDYHGITLSDHSDKSSVIKNKINKFYNGILVKETTSASLKSNKVKNSANAGILVQKSNSLSLSGNVVNKTKKNGIYVDSSKKVVFSKDKITNSSEHGIWFADSTATLSKVTVSKVKKNHGIVLGTSKCNVKIKGASISGCAKKDIYKLAGKLKVYK